MKTRYLLLVLVTTIMFHKNIVAQDTNWVKKNTWYFDNFVKDVLPWSLFRETFVGVAPAPSADFDQVFYDALYKTQLASKGHCYGMDVLAMLMLKNGGCYGYCHPPYMYSGSFLSNTNPDGMPNNDTIGPSDPNLRTAIQIIHGYQINHGFLSFLLDVIAINMSRDGRYSYQQTDFYLAKNDPPVISVTKALSPADGGHVIVPYFTKNMGGTKRIYVYDPNRSFYEPGADGKDWYKNGNNYIEINSGSGEWKFTMAGGELWTGSPGSGGHCIVIPTSVAGRRDRLPQSLLADGAYALNTIFIFGDVKVEQIKDPVNHRCYLDADGNNLEPCEEKRLSNIFRFIPLGRPASVNEKERTETYFFRGADPVDLQFRAKGAYRIAVIYRGRYYEEKGIGNGAVQYFRLSEMVKKEVKAF